MQTIFRRIVIAAALGAAQPATAQEVPQPLNGPSPPRPAETPTSQARPVIPANDPRSWLAVQDYPDLAIRDGRGGAVGFSVAVGPDGSITSCRVTASSGSADLDEATCKVIRKKATFHPALDVRGAPIPGTYSSRVQWKFGYEPANFETVLVKRLEPTEHVLTYFVEIDGTIRNCVEFENGRPVEISQSWSPCKFLGTTKPYVDESGKPVRKFVTQRFTVTVADAPTPASSLVIPSNVQNCGR